MKVQVLVPRATPADDGLTPVEFARRPAGLRGLRIGFLDNTKPNSDRLFRAISAYLQEHHEPGIVVHRSKHDSSSPAADGLLDALAEDCDLVVVGVAD
jgi:hypothetical protein